MRIELPESNPRPGEIDRDKDGRDGHHVDERLEVERVHEEGLGGGEPEQGVDQKEVGQAKLDLRETELGTWGIF